MRIDRESVSRVGAGAAAAAPAAPAEIVRLSGGRCGFRWLGHAGVSLVWDDHCLVFDPVVTRRLACVFARRLPVVFPPVIPVGVVFLSHAHRDHFHAPSLRLLQPRVVVVPKGTARYLPDLPAQVIELAAGETAGVAGFRVEAHAMRHPGWRQPFSPSYPALGYRVERDGFSVFHAGDSAPTPAFARLGATGAPDLAFLPIGAYSPRFVLRDKHLSPEEAVRAALDLRARLTVPVHFGTFRLSFEPPAEPFPRFVRAAAAAGLVWAEPWERD